MTSFIRSILPAHTALGIEITDTQIKICELKSDGGNARVTAAQYAALPEGAMNDGRIQDIAALRQTIQKLLDQRKWKTKHVHFAIPSQSVMVRLLKLPDVSYKEMAHIVHFEMNNNIHLPFDDPHYDFVKLKRKDAPAPKQHRSAAVAQAAYRAEAVAAAERPDAFSGSGDVQPPQPEMLCDVMLIAASLDVINQYTQLFTDLDLRLRSIEIKAFSLHRLLERSMASTGAELVLLADVNTTTCDLTIVQHGIVKLTRNVPVSMIARPAAAGHADDLFADFMPKAESYDGSFNDLVAEVERFMNFYRYTLNNREHEFERLVLSGDIPMLGELQQFLAGRLALPVTMLPSDLMQGVSSAEKDTFYAVPLGLCLRGNN